MKFSDLFDIDVLFHPRMFYEGEIILGNTIEAEDSLVLNAKTRNKENLYLKYLEKYYYMPLKGLINSNSLAHVVPPTISLGDKGSGVRTTNFSFLNFVEARLVSGVGAEKHLQELIELGEKASIREFNELFRECHREKRKMYDDVLKNGKSSPYYEEVLEIYNTFVGYGTINMSFVDTVQNLKDSCTKMIVGARYYPDFFEKEINIEELLECFDYDKFCLIAAHSVLENCKLVDKEYGEVHNSAIYLIQYLEAVEEFRNKYPHYNCSIVTVDKETKQKCVIDIDDVKNEFEVLLSRHPEFKRFTITDENIHGLLRAYGYDEEYIKNFDLSSKEAGVLEEILLKIDKNKALLASWNIIPKGSRKEEQQVTVRVPREATSSLEEQEKIRRMVIGRDFLENSNYLFYLSGINNFEGYQGYIYPSGAVVFEKFYADVKTKKVASGNATYIMNLDNFVEVSRLNKSEIVSKINSGEIVGVKRVFHRADMDRWKAQIAQSVTGNDYSSRVIDYIDNLVNNEVISKRGTGK